MPLCFLEGNVRGPMIHLKLLLDAVDSWPEHQSVLGENRGGNDFQRRRVRELV